MVKVKGPNGEFYLDGILQSNLDTAKKVVGQDWDMVFVVDGVEGGGKSVMTMQMACYCDPNMTYKNYAFSAYQFKKAILGAQKFQAIVYDEAHAGLNSRAAMSYINRSIVSMLTEIRQKNLFVFVVLPTFFDLDRYVALWRSRALIHIYTKGSFERGYFAFFNTQRKKDLYMKGKKLYQYGASKPNFIGRFTNTYPLDEKEYRRLKAESLANSERASEDTEMVQRVNQILWERLMAIGDKITNEVKYELLGISKMTFYRWLNEWKLRENGQKVEQLPESMVQNTNETP